VTPPRECLPLGEACIGVGRNCCEGLTCASGQGGKQDVACYAAAGAPCETTAGCVFGSHCILGRCVADPQPVSCDVTVGGGGAALQQALDRARTAGNVTISVEPGEYVGDFTLGASTGIVTLQRCGDAGTVTLRNATAKTRALAVGANGATRLIVESISITCGTCANRGSGGGISVTGPSTLILAGTTSIRDNSWWGGTVETQSGGGIQATSGATVTIRDQVAVTGNDSEKGGGIYAASEAWVMVADRASISGNTGYAGGGIHATSGATVTVTGQAVVQDNSTGSAAFGGGIYMENDGAPAGPTTVTVKDAARILRNEAGYGGGVYVRSGILSIVGSASVSSNVAHNGIGGGIYLAGGSGYIGCPADNLSCTSGVVIGGPGAGNTVEPLIVSGYRVAIGGGITAGAGATLVISGGTTISHNLATNDSSNRGSGIDVNTLSQLTCAGTNTICENPSAADDTLARNCHVITGTFPSACGCCSA